VGRELGIFYTLYPLYLLWKFIKIGFLRVEVAEGLNEG